MSNLETPAPGGSELPPTAPEGYQVGDRIRCHSDKPKYKDRLGVVHKTNPDICLVRLDGSEKIFQFPYHEVEILDATLFPLPPPPPPPPKKKKPLPPPIVRSKRG
jgi:hypothetical protein